MRTAPASTRWRICYADGSHYSSIDGSWLAAPSIRVLFVWIYEARTYERVERGRTVREHYVAPLYQGDYYWRVIADGTFGCGTALECPTSDLAEIKLGGLVADDEFTRHYNECHVKASWDSRTGAVRAGT